MKPIKLVMSAFGPYAKETVVDFDVLGESGIYLVTGDTGAGKTTIFDAIVFALYGEASGENREPTMFRSKYAEPLEKTFVKLEFCYSGKKYLIERNPEYHRPAKRGEGITKEKANATLILPDNRVVTGSSKVTNQIISLIGLNKNQFSQIAMIAQGDFLKLLLAKTEDRSRIFREIFNTKPYLVLQEQLKSQSGKLSGEYSQLKAGIDNYIGDIKCSDENPHIIDVNSAKNGELTVEQILRIVNALVEEDFQEAGNLDHEISMLNEEIDKINKILGKEEAKEKARKERTAAQELLGELVPKLSLAQVEFKSKEENPEKAKELYVQIQLGKEKLEAYDRIDFQQKNLQKLVLSLEQMKKSQGLIKEEIQKDKKNLDESKKLLESMESVETDKVKYQGVEEKIATLLDQTNKLGDDIKAYNSAYKSMETLKAKYLVASEKSREATLTFNSLNTAYLDGQAGILAEGLEEGQPCPVCGSLSHPNKAIMTDLIPSEAELKDAKAYAGKAQLSASEASTKAGQAKGICQTSLNKLVEDGARIFGHEIGDNIEELSALVEEKEKQLLEDKATNSKKLKETQTLINKKRMISENLGILEKKLEFNNNKLSEFDKQISASESRIQEVNSQISKEIKNLEFESKELAVAEIKKKEQAKKLLETQYDGAKKSFDDLNQQVSQLQSTIKALKNQIDDQGQINTLRIRENQSALVEKKNALSSQLRLVQSRHDINERIADSILSRMEAIEVVEKQWVMVKALSNTANGQVSGKERIKLETYIQIHYFDRIIARANTRFMIMSDGQYELIRRATADKLNTQSGLELDVIDHYNGSTRSIKTLSGGESFKASLALALGLADEIQASSGGIKLDTMFVDEGFGSLDQESLEQAIKVLNGLTEGNRLVGIISHVAELKERIDKQIVVSKDRSGGSKVKVIG